MQTKVTGKKNFCCRAPQGVRGLKLPRNLALSLYHLSCLTRGTWIETTQAYGDRDRYTVVPRKGHVDWNRWPKYRNCSWLRRASQGRVDWSMANLRVLKMEGRRASQNARGLKCTPALSSNVETVVVPRNRHVDWNLVMHRDSSITERRASQGARGLKRNHGLWIFCAALWGRVG